MDCLRKHEEGGKHVTVYSTSSWTSERERERERERGPPRRGPQIEREKERERERGPPRRGLQESERERERGRERERERERSTSPWTSERAREVKSVEGVGWGAGIPGH